MAIEPILTFRHLHPSPEVEAVIRDEVLELQRFYDGITECRVLVEVPHRHHRHGNRCRVRIALSAPGTTLVNTVHEATTSHGDHVTKDTETGAAERHVMVAVQEAFESARRRLQDFVRRQRGAVKTHPRRAAR